MHLSSRHAWLPSSTAGLRHVLWHRLLFSPLPEGLRITHPIFSQTGVPRDLTSAAPANPFLHSCPCASIAALMRRLVWFDISVIAGQSCLFFIKIYIPTTPSTPHSQLSRLSPVQSLFFENRLTSFAEPIPSLPLCISPICGEIFHRF